jgi:hypothetical protein
VKATKRWVHLQGYRERATVGDESDEEKASAVSEETERATVGGESDREYRETECIWKRDSERVTVGKGEGMKRSINGFRRKLATKPAIYSEAKATQSEETDETATKKGECIQLKKACYIRYEAAIQSEER